MKYLSLVLLLCCIHNWGNAQSPYNIFWVGFTDKTNTPYSVFQPQAFLSAKALERRSRQGISIDERDLPVDPQYVKELQKLGGAQWRYSLKWLNGAVFFTTDTTFLAQAQKLDFVREAFPIGYRRAVKEVKKRERSQRRARVTTQHPYGFAANQTEMLHAQYLHDLGFDGREVSMAIFDGGFDHVNTMPAFDSLFQSFRIVSTHDFVQGDEYVYESSTHGTNVLATIAANMPHIIVGTAPQAYFHLFKTEDVNGEFWIEEYNWVAAAERADSLGVEVINSSLGYTSFDDDEMSYSYEDMDGKTAAITRGANIAAEKGILVVNSAGNSGGSKWKYIGAPADGHGVFSIGAVNPNRDLTYFSSRGPTADGRVKPNVVAQGGASVVASLRGYDYSTANGTSFSSPILSGAVSSLRTAFPHHRNFELMAAIERSSNQADSPDGDYGFGLPNFFQAYQLLSERSVRVGGANSQEIRSGELEILLPSELWRHLEKAHIRLYDTDGGLLLEEHFQPDFRPYETTYCYRLKKALPGPGQYILEVATWKHNQQIQIIFLP